MKILPIMVLVLASANATAGWSFYASTGIDQGYLVGSGFEVTPHLFQKNFVGAYKGSWFVEFWTGTDLEEEGVLEIDYTIGRNWSVGETSITTKVDWYDIKAPSLGFGDTAGDILHPAVSISHPLTESTRAFAEAEYFVVMEDDDANGFFGNIGVSHQEKFGAVSVTGKIRGGYDSSYGADTWYGRAEVSSSYQVNEKVSVSGPGVKHIWSGGDSVTSYNLIGIGVSW